MQELKEEKNYLRDIESNIDVVSISQSNAFVEEMSLLHPNLLYVHPEHRNLLTSLSQVYPV